MARIYKKSPSKFPQVQPVAFAATGFACPPLADNFIYGLKPVEFRRNIKTQHTTKKTEDGGQKPALSEVEGTEDGKQMTEN